MDYRDDANGLPLENIEKILDRITAQDPEGAMISMENHLRDIIEFSIVADK